MSPAARAVPEARAQPDGGDVGGTPPSGHPERRTLAAGYGPGTRRLRASVVPKVPRARVLGGECARPASLKGEPGSTRAAALAVATFARWEPG